MRALVHLTLPDGRVEVLGPGDVIGRMWSATLRLDDPGISEAHALVSLRGEELQLLALRGRFLVDGQARQQVALAPGQRLQLSLETELVVEAVELPDAVLALDGDGLTRQILVGSSSLFTVPHPRLVPGADPSAEAVVWSDGEGWRLRIGDGAVQPLEPGDTFQVGGRSFCAVPVALAKAGQPRTRVTAAVDRPLRIEARYDTVHLEREGLPVLVLSGQQARLVSELVAMGGAAPWEIAAQEVWPDTPDRNILRRRWDVCVAKLRSRLRAAGLRHDLLRSSGSGQMELMLRPDDVVVDLT